MFDFPIYFCYFFLKKMVFDNRRITISKVADDVGISFGSYQAIFTDVLGRKRAEAKIVPKFAKQKQRRMDIAQEMFQICSKKS